MAITRHLAFHDDNTVGKRSDVRKTSAGRTRTRPPYSQRLVRVQHDVNQFTRNKQKIRMMSTQRPCQTRFCGDHERELHPQQACTVADKKHKGNNRQCRHGQPQMKCSCRERGQHSASSSELTIHNEQVKLHSLTAHLTVRGVMRMRTTRHVSATTATCGFSDHCDGSIHLAIVVGERGRHSRSSSSSAMMPHV